MRVVPAPLSPELAFLVGLPTKIWRPVHMAGLVPQSRQEDAIIEHLLRNGLVEKKPCKRFTFTSGAMFDICLTVAGESLVRRIPKRGRGH